MKKQNFILKVWFTIFPPKEKIIINEIIIFSSDEETFMNYSHEYARKMGLKENSQSEVLKFFQMKHQVILFELVCKTARAFMLNNVPAVIEKTAKTYKCNS